MNSESRIREQAWEEIITRVAEILFIYTLRDCLHLHPHRHASGALVALSDHRIARALQAVPAEPAFAWSIDALAARAALSRSAFTDIFRAALGVSPMQYVTIRRMHKARALLDRPGYNIQQIALDVGYESESAFNRAFRRYFGAPPGRYRRVRAGRTD